MTGAQIFALYGAPWIIVLGGGLLTWQNRVEMRRAHKRNEAAALEARQARQQERAGLPVSDSASRKKAAQGGARPAPRRGSQP